MSRPYVVRDSSIHGRGIFAARDLKKGRKVVEYHGRLITHAEADEAYGGNEEGGHTFLFTLNEQYVIDGGVGGNEARWINHSCNPNCEAFLYEDEGPDRSRDRIVIETMRDVRKGEELTYDYGLVFDIPHTRRLQKIWACRCGAAQCTGTMLLPKRKRRALAE